MKITPNQTFLHGRNRYEQDTEYDVPESEAHYFVANGWADSDDLQVDRGDAPGEVDLDVHDAGSNQEG